MHLRNLASHLPGTEWDVPMGLLYALRGLVQGDGMTRCVDFYYKWKVEPNFCGLGKTAQRNTERYLEYVEYFSKKYEIPQAVIYKFFPLSSVKYVLRFREGSQPRNIAEEQIAKILAGKRKTISSKTIKKALGISSLPKSGWGILNPVLKRKVSLPTSNPNAPDIVRKRQLMRELLTKGQLSTLYEYAIEFGYEDEYAVLAFLIKEASVRVDTVKTKSKECAV